MKNMHSLWKIKNRGDEIEIEVGSIKLKVVIDSGASVNIISSLLWEDLKEQKIKCKSVCLW